jgi:hypothetical protein
VNNVLPILMFALAGLLLGGAYSFGKQGAPRAVLVVMGALATLALLAGIFWLLP